MRFRARLSAVLVGCLVVQPTLLGLLALRFLNAPPTGLEESFAPIHGVVVKDLDDKPRAAAVQLAKSEEADLVSPPGLGGVVTALDVELGSTLSHLSPIGKVDGRSIYAVASDSPFHRDLVRGDKGDDVIMLQELLRDSGFRDSEPTGVVDSSTSGEVQAFNRNAGAASPTRRFSRASVIWLPASEALITGISIGVGRPTPSFGERLLTLRWFANGSTIVDRSGRVLDVSAPVEVLFDGVPVGQVASPAIGAELAGELALLQAAKSSPGNGSAAQEGNSGSETSALVPIELLSLSANEKFLVPVGAVISPAETGDRCLYVAAEGSYAAMATSVVGGEFGMIEISPAPPEGAEVLLNPLEVITAPDCAVR